MHVAAAPVHLQIAAAPPHWKIDVAPPPPPPRNLHVAVPPLHLQIASATPPLNLRAHVVLLHLKNHQVRYYICSSHLHLAHAWPFPILISDHVEN